MKAENIATSACYETAHTGKFDCSHNSYAKDANALDNKLPTKDDKHDYEATAMVILAVQMLVIKDIVLYLNKKVDKIKDIRKREG